MKIRELEELESILGTKFKHIELLKEALTHRSYLNENPSWPLPHNERLEYLGDAVLELAVTEFLFGKYPEKQEGELTTLRAALVNYQMLAKVSREMPLEKFLFLSRGESKDSGKAREVILANAMEAVIGSIHLDLGYEAAKKFVHKFILPHIEEVIAKDLVRDPKSVLQELVQEKAGVTPTYRVLNEEGPSHQKRFKVGVYVRDEYVGVGTGFSKQEAELNAAETALRKLAPKKTGSKRG